MAGFVGYSTLLDEETAAAIGGPIPGPGESIGLRPSALVLDPLGPLTGQAVLVTPAPGGLLLTVRIEGVGSVQAVGPADRMVAAGDTVRLRLDPAGSAIVPGDRPMAGRR